MTRDGNDDIRDERRGKEEVAREIRVLEMRQEKDGRGRESGKKTREDEMTKHFLDKMLTLCSPG